MLFRSNAAGNFRNAIALNPDELEFRVNLLEALIGANDKPDAKRILAEIDSLLPLIKKVPFEHLKRIEAARAALVG